LETPGKREQRNLQGFDSKKGENKRKGRLKERGHSSGLASREKSTKECPKKGTRGAEQKKWAEKALDQREWVPDSAKKTGLWEKQKAKGGG